MRANYRTSEGNWSNIDYPILLVKMNENDSFTLCGYKSEAAVEMGQALVGVADVLEYQISEDED